MSLAGPAREIFATFFRRPSRGQGLAAFLVNAGREKGQAPEDGPASIRAKKGRPHKDGRSKNDKIEKVSIRQSTSRGMSGKVSF